MATTTTAGRNGKPESFSCTLRCGADRYALTPLPVHPEIGARAYRLHKLTGGGELYDVLLHDDGHAECDCPGHVRWGHCKHARMLIRLGCLPPGSQREPEPRPAARKPAYRSAADFARNDPEGYERMTAEAPGLAGPTADEIDQMADAHFGGE